MHSDNSQWLKDMTGSLKLQNNWIKSKKTRKYSCWEVLESVAWIWRILGIFPITITGPIGMKRYVINKVFFTYSLLIFFICISNFIYVMVHFHKYFRENAFHITSVTILIRSSTSLSCMFMSNVYRNYHYKELLSSINNMLEQNAILENINCRIHWESNVKIIRGYVWASLGIVSSLMCYEMVTQYDSVDSSLIEYIFWNLPLVIQIIDLSIFVTLVGFLGLKFCALNKKIQSIVARANTCSPKVIITSDVCAENLRMACKCHYHICALGKRINRLFDCDVVINVMTGFIILSTTLYYIFYEVQRDGETNFIAIVSYVQFEIYHVTPVIIIVIVCNWTSRQATYTGKLIHEIRVENSNSRLYETIKSFSLQMHHQKLEFTACGFFPVNSTLLQSMMGNITTYLVILIQFEPKLD